MKKIIFSILISYLCQIQNPLIASTSSYLTPQNKELFNELKLMYEKDQDARIQSMCSENIDRFKAIEEIDHENVLRLKTIVNQYGWVGFNLVGEEGAGFMWVLAQHCDRDIEFQKTCLQLLENAVIKNDAPRDHLAFLMDRVLVNQGKAQIYGTQIQFIEGKVIPSLIESPDDLDKRRKEMGLCPFSEYLSLFKETFHLEK